MNNNIRSKKNGIITSLDYISSRKTRVIYWCLFAILIINIIVCLFPIIFAFLSGFKNINEFYDTNVTIFPEKIEISKVKEILETLQFGKALFNSLFVFVLVWFGNIIVGGIAGYTMSRLQPKGWKLLFRLMLWTMMMPGTLSMVPMFMTWADVPLIHYSFLNTYVPLVFPSMCNIFNILLFKTFFDGIPSSIIEAAKIDGCSNIKIFLSIVMPLSKPIIATISIFVFNDCWNDFMGPFLYLKDPGLATVALKLYNTTLSMSEPEQLLSAFVVMIPTLIVFCVFSKQIISNNMSAGVKE